MKPVLADTSAVLAYLLREPAGEVVREQLNCIALSPVNITEVVSVLTRRNVTPTWIRDSFLNVFDRRIDFTLDIAILAGELILPTQGLGLSLGDRACLATALHQGCPVLTADRAWQKLSLELDIRLIR